MPHPEDGIYSVSPLAFTFFLFALRLVPLSLGQCLVVLIKMSHTGQNIQQSLLVSP